MKRNQDGDALNSLPLRVAPSTSPRLLHYNRPQLVESLEEGVYIVALPLHSGEWKPG